MEVCGLYMEIFISQSNDYYETLMKSKTFWNFLITLFLLMELSILLVDEVRIL